jgi:mannitol 2-dehydrogenase
MVDEAITHPPMRDFIRKHYMEEVTPTLEPVPGIDLNAYKDTLVSRFSNKSIADTILRLTAFSSVRFTNFVLKPLSIAVQRGLPHKAITFAVAGCARFLSGADEGGRPIPVASDIDDVTELKKAAAGALDNPGVFFSKVGTLDLGGKDLAAFETEFKECLGAIYARGVASALAEVVK